MGPLEAPRGRGGVGGGVESICDVLIVMLSIGLVLLHDSVGFAKLSLKGPSRGLFLMLSYCVTYFT